MNIVGTPCTAVQRSASIAVRTARGSKPAAEYTIVAPCTTQARFDITMPKQWYSGTGTQSRSASLNPVLRPTKYALLTRLRCDSVAPFGSPVVPLVNWILIGSRLLNTGRVAESVGSPCVERSSNSNHPGRRSPPIFATILSAGSRFASSAPGRQ